MKPQIKLDYLAKAHDHLIDFDNFHRKQITTFGACGADSAGRQFKTLTGATEDTRHFTRCNRVDQTNYFEITVEKNSVDGILHAEHVNAAARRYQKAFSGWQRRCTEQTFQAGPEGLGQTRTGGHCTAFSGVDETQSRLSRVYFQVALSYLVPDMIGPTALRMVTTAGPSMGQRMRGITKIMITGTILTGTLPASSSFLRFSLSLRADAC
jgi:hypothetical protein